MKKVFTFFLTLFVASSVWAYDFVVDGIYYDIDEELNSSVRVTYKVQKEESYKGSITIPSSVTYDGKIYNVTSIGEWAFQDCSGLTSVTIPNSVTSIGDEAFYSCSGLTSVTIPNSVTSIGDEAFYSCSGLTSLTIPNSVTSIGYGAFYGCSLTSVTIPNSVTSIGNFAFEDCKYLTSVTIPNSVTSIVAGAFYGCSGLTSLTIPNSVTSIGGEAFYGCSGLTSVTIGNSVTSIGYRAFRYCSGLTSVTIPNSVTSIGDGAFWNCTGLTSITIPESLDVSGAYIYFTKDGIRYYVLNGKEVEVASNSYTGDIVIPQMVSAGNTFTITSIGYWAFYGCSGLTSVTIPNSVTSIGYGAFSGCSGLTSVTIPNSVEWIGEEAFCGCSGLKNVVIGENVTSIGENAFFDCSALSRVTCYAVNPPDAAASSFSNYNGYLTIPCDNFEAYDIHPVWGSFKHVDCISAESIELSSDEVVVEPEISEAVFSMPTNASANSYTLTIQSNGVTFCTLTFNNQGQLSNIDFSNSQLKAAVEGYQFTVTGLSASTGYNYSFKALDKSKSVLKEYTGSFTTKNADGTGGSSTTAIDDVEFANAISIINNQIFVNGEAPEFVITSLGQKIANQNLQAGVYFVQVGNEKQGVAVK